jgi:hypothetical protein
VVNLGGTCRRMRVRPLADLLTDAIALWPWPIGAAAMTARSAGTTKSTPWFDVPLLLARGLEEVLRIKDPLRDLA